jgi:hypothetical protein
MNNEEMKEPKRSSKADSAGRSPSKGQGKSVQGSTPVKTGQSQTSSQAQFPNMAKHVDNLKSIAERGSNIGS